VGGRLATNKLIISISTPKITYRVPFSSLLEMEKLAQSA
jgi:hypothetical protein